MAEAAEVSPTEEEAPPPPLYSEKPPTYQEATKTSSNGESTPPPSLITQYGTMPEEVDTTSETALDPTEQPPSYASLFGEIQEARRRSDTIAGFLKNFVVLLLGTLGCTFCVGLVLAIPVSMIVMGSIHFHGCPIERMIPIYLIVFGVIGVLKNLISLAKRIKARYDKDDEAAARENKFDNMVNCFLLAWFIAGNIWIYRIYHPTDAECNYALYQFAFWMTTTVYIVFCVLISCILCAAVCAFGSTDTPNSHA